MVTKSKKMWGVLDDGDVFYVYPRRREASETSSELNCMLVGKQMPKCKAIRVTVTWEAPDEN